MTVTSAAKEKAIINEEDSEDLRKFRQEWLQELQQRKLNELVENSRVIPLFPRETERKSPAGKSKEPITRTLPPTHPLIKNGEVEGEGTVPSSLRKALDTYSCAVELEQNGDLDEALHLYRQAFRLHDKVDRAYQHGLMLRSIAKEQGVRHKAKDLPAIGQTTVIGRPSNTSMLLSGTLATIVQGFPTDLEFEPEDEKEPILLNNLPEEVIVLLLSKLDAASIERFATVCRKARVLTLDAGIWGALVRVTYRPPQIPDHKSILPILETYRFDYRRLYIEHPRVRLDGVYIAICHYVRPGLSENHWVNVSHLITYQRYLRFFQNGQVLSLLANEEKRPQEVIPILKPTLRMKGLFFGQWKLIGTTVHISNLIDASSSFALQSSSMSSDGAYVGIETPFASLQVGRQHRHGPNSSVPVNTSRYAFDMTLNLRSKPLGRWNRMDIQSYESVNLETEDVSPVALKHERPFWFSKVRSYT